MKIKLKTSGDASSVPSTPLTETPTTHMPPTPQAPPSASSGKVKLKFTSSQPPTPVVEAAPPLATPLGPPPTKPSKRPYIKKPKPDGPDDASKKRTAPDDIAPVAKRPTISLGNGSRRGSIVNQESDRDDLVATTPRSSAAAGPKITFKPKRVQIQQAERRDSKRFFLKNKKGPPPKRPVGVGYDSEASDAESDPLIESQFVLRMQPGDDCEYLRDAITNKTLGLPRSEGGADVTLKFLDKDHRRVTLTIRGKLYAAAMVDLPCIVEGMKSWDKRGWWKVADICQMMLVLGPTETDDTAKTYPLPKEVDKNTWAYAHGLTPPMHWVRKRRFRKRASYKTVEHIDEEVERLIGLDKEAESSTYKIVDDTIDDAATAADDDEEYDEEEPENYLSSTENGYGQYQYTEEPDEDEGFDAANLEAELLAGLETGDGDNDPAGSDPAAALPPLPVADAAANLGAVRSAMAEAGALQQSPAPAASHLDTSSAAPTPAAQEESEDESSDEDASDDDDDDDVDDQDTPPAVDQDLVERERELEGQRQDLEELERRIQQAKADIAGQKNALLRQRKIKTLEHLEDELEVKKRALGLGEDDE